MYREELNNESFHWHHEVWWIFISKNDFLRVAHCYADSFTNRFKNIPKVFNSSRGQNGYEIYQPRRGFKRPCGTELLVTKLPHPSFFCAHRDSIHVVTVHKTEKVKWSGNKDDSVNDSKLFQRDQILARRKNAKMKSQSADNASNITSRRVRCEAIDNRWRWSSLSLFIRAEEN